MANIVSSNNLTSLYGSGQTTILTTTPVPNVAGTVQSKNLTTLYSGSGNPVQAVLPYGNSNVEAFLNAGTDGANSVQNIVASGNITANYYFGNGYYLTGVGNAANATTANYAYYAGNVTINAQPNITSLGTLTQLTVNGISNLGNIGNVHITGGNANYALITDGNGNLSWGQVANASIANFANFAGNVTGANQPNITNIGTLGNLSVTGTVTSGNVSTPTVYSQGMVTQGYDFVQMQYSNSVTLPVSPYDIGTGSWFYLDGGGATFQSNTTGAFKEIVLGNDGGINATGNVTAPYFIGNGSQLTGIVATSGNANYANFAGQAFNVNAANITGTVANSNFAAYSEQANNANLATFATTANSVAGANVSGEVANANFASYSEQANNANLATFATTANSVAGANVSGEVANANFASYANLASTANSVNVANVVGIGNIATTNYDGNAGNVLYGNGGFYALPTISNVANANYANFAGQVVDNTQSNITALGTLANLSVTGNIDTQNNVTALKYYAATGGDEFSGYGFVGASNSNTAMCMTSTDEITFYNNAIETLSLYANNDAKFYANLQANYYFGDGSQLSNINGGNVSNVANANYANFAGTAYSVDGANVSGTVANANFAAYSEQANNANLATYATTANSVAGANVSGEVANANFASYANIANTANSVSVANVVGIGNIATTNYDGNAGNILYGNGGFYALPVISNVANANYANYAGQANTANLATFATTANAVAGANVSGTVANANYSLYSNIANTANLATFATTANSVAGANVSGQVANANYALYANIASTANTVAGANVSGTVANANYAAYAGNVTVASQGNITTVGNLLNLNIVNTTANSTQFLFTPNGTNVGVAGQNTASFVINQFNTQPGTSNSQVLNMQFNAARGNITNPANVANADYIGRMAWNSYNGNTYVRNALITVLAPQGGDPAFANANVAWGAGSFFINTGNPLGNVTSNTTNTTQNIFSFNRYGAVLINPGTPGPNAVVQNALTLQSYGANTDGAGSVVNRILFQRSRGNRDSTVAVSNNDGVGSFTFLAYNGTNYNGGASMYGVVDTAYGSITPGGNTPVKLNFTITSSNGTNYTTALLPDGNVSFPGKAVIGGYYYGDGSNLTNITASYLSNSILGGRLTLNTTGAGSPQFIINGDGTVNSSTNLINAQALYNLDNVDTSTGFSPFRFNQYQNSNSSVGPLRFYRTRGTMASPLPVIANDQIVDMNFAVYGDSGNLYLPVGDLQYTVNSNDGLGNVTVAATLNGPAGGGIGSTLTFGFSNTYANIFTASYLKGDGSNLSNIAGANVSGAVAYATTANSVAGANVSGQVGNALIAGTVYTNAQPNITSVGTLGNLVVSGNANIGNLQLHQFYEQNYNIGTVSGTPIIDLNLGSIQKMTINGNITLNSLANVNTGSSATIIINQDSSGNHTLSSTWKFAGGYKTLSTAPNSTDIISVFYDGSVYYASLTTGYV